MKQNRTEKMDFRCSPEEKKGIEELAKYLDMSSGTLLRNLTLSSYNDAIIFKKLGLLRGARKYQEFKEKYSELFKPSLPGFE